MTDNAVPANGDQLEVHWDKLTGEKPSASAESPHAGLWRRLASVTGNTNGVYPPTDLEHTLKFRIFNTGFILAAIEVIVAVICLVLSIVIAFRPRATVGPSLVLDLFFLVLLSAALLRMTWASCVVVTRSDITVRGFFRKRQVAIAQLISVEMLETIDDGASVVDIQLFTTVGPPLRTPLKASQMSWGPPAVDECRFALTSALEQRGFRPGQSVANDPG